MVRIRGGYYTVGELGQKIRRMPPRAVVRNAADVARAPVRRVQVAVVARTVTPGSLPMLLGTRSRERCLSYLRADAWCRWPTGPGALPALSAAIRANLPEAVDDAERRATRALRHEFDLLGTGPFTFANDIDWLCDVKTGSRWEPGYYRGIEYSGLGRPSDVKVPWEISRCHQLMDLARAHAVRPRSAYVEEVEAQLASFRQANPVGMTVNWACTMEVAIRAVNWCWALSVVAPDLGDEDLLAAGCALFQHGAFIAGNLERSEVAGNHYITDAVGLIAVGTVLRRGRAARRWLALGESILLEELRRQVLDDGVDHEMSVPYHRLCTEIFLFGMLLLRLAGRNPDQRHWRRLEQMGEFIAAYTRPDGSAPVWGDADDGRLHRFGSRCINDHRHLLSTLAVLFAREDFAHVAGALHEETLWLLGGSAADRFAALAPKQDDCSAVAFPCGGFAVLRAGDVHVLFDAGPVGLRGRGGHGHNDALAFELWWDGPLIVDPGSYTYTADARARNEFRSTLAHNTPVLAGCEIADLGGENQLWTIADQAHARLVEVADRGGGGRGSGLHIGYERLHPGATVRRTIDVSPLRVLVRDAVLSEAGEWAVNFTFAPDVQVESASTTRVELVRGDSRFVMRFDGAAAVDVALTRVSPSYGVVLPTQKLRVVLGGALLITTIRTETRRDG